MEGYEITDEQSQALDAIGDTLTDLVSTISSLQLDHIREVEMIRTKLEEADMWFDRAQELLGDEEGEEGEESGEEE